MIGNETMKEYTDPPTDELTKLNRILFINNTLYSYDLHSKLNDIPSIELADKVILVIKGTIKNSKLVFSADDGEELANKLEELKHILELSVDHYDQYIEELKEELKELLK